MQTKLRPHWCSGVCVTACVQPLARWHGCCERSQGEHLPHRTDARQQQSGRCGRRCTCKSPAGNGFGVNCIFFQSTCFLLPQMSRYTVVLAAGVVRLLCNVCVCCFCFFFCLEEKHSLVRKVLKVGVARFSNRLRQMSLSPSALARVHCAITTRLQDCCGAFRITTVMSFQRAHIARQDIALRLEEASSTVNTLQ